MMEVKSIKYNKLIYYYFKLEAVTLLQFLKTDTLRNSSQWLSIHVGVGKCPCSYFLPSLINSLAAWNQILYFLVYITSCNVSLTVYTGLSELTVRNDKKL